MTCHFFLSTSDLSSSSTNSTPIVDEATRSSSRILHFEVGSIDIERQPRKKVRLTSTGGLAHMNVKNNLFYPVRLLVLPVNGTTVTITKSAVELDEDPLLAPINPIVVV